MRLPNLLEHETVNEVIEQAAPWIPLHRLNCHPDTQVFVYLNHVMNWDIPVGLVWYLLYIAFKHLCSSCSCVHCLHQFA